MPTRLEFARVATLAALQFTPSYREAPQINPEIDRDRLCWDINRYSTALTSIDDPMLTGELLSQIHVAAVKSGHITIAELSI
jgi:Ca-activated chloride channel family protein